MLKPRYDWKLAVPGLVQDKDIFSHILKNRKIADLNEFFHLGKETCHDPFLFPDMSKAKTRILQAISAREKIVIYGDYDCDGITSISMLFRALRKLGANVSYDLPNRFTDGYGLGMRAVKELIDARANLVITVDNGISCVEEVAFLQKSGIDVIITDHHEFQATLPPAFAIIHPKLAPKYPFKELAGVGVAYKLACAVSENDLDDLLDLVMIGTIADLVPLVEENQAIVNLGLVRLAKTSNIGLKKLLLHSHLTQINATAIAFKIAPKINSSGRLNKALDAVKLLVTESETEANDLILDIEANHLQRKDLTEEAYDICEDLVCHDDAVIVVASNRLHEGIIGICAQKLVEKYQKTTCVIDLDANGQGKGSMRAYGSDNVLELLKANQDLLDKFGGHSQAAGLQIDGSKIDLFRSRLNANPIRHPRPTIDVDMEVNLAVVTAPTVELLEKYSFFTAKFLLRNLLVLQKTVMTEKHTKLTVSHQGKLFEAVMFNQLDYYYNLAVGDTVSIVAGLALNVWKNTAKIQLMIKDLACEHPQVLDLRDIVLAEDASTWLREDGSAISIDDTRVFGKGSLHAAIGQAKTVRILPKSGPYHPEHYFDKAGLADLYRLIPKTNAVPLSDIAKSLRLPETLVQRVAQVFSELGFVKTAENTVVALPTDAKKEIASASAYQILETAIADVTFLYQANETALRQRILDIMEDNET